MVEIEIHPKSTRGLTGIQPTQRGIVRQILGAARAFRQVGLVKFWLVAGPRQILTPYKTPSCVLARPPLGRTEATERRSSGLDGIDGQCYHGA